MGVKEYLIVQPIVIDHENFNILLHQSISLDTLM